MTVAAIMPCRGRPKQTVRNVRRLLATAGLEYGADWQLHLVGGADERDILPVIASQIADETRCRVVLHTATAPRLTYWQAMQRATARTDAPLLLNLANDLLPGQHWLARARDAYRATFGAQDGMLGLNDGHHQVDHSPHFLISRALLDSFGGWPVWYDHNYGDTELCARAQAHDRYAKAPWAVLYHDHPYFGGDDDVVYAEGRAQLGRDRALFDTRRHQGWPPV